MQGLWPRFIYLVSTFGFRIRPCVTMRQYRKSLMIDSVFKITWGHMSSPPPSPVVDPPGVTLSGGSEAADAARGRAGEKKSLSAFSPSVPRRRRRRRRRRKKKPFPPHYCQSNPIQSPIDSGDCQTLWSLKKGRGLS